MDPKKLRALALQAPSSRLIYKRPSGPPQPKPHSVDLPPPSTGRTTGACPGWVVDHVQPLCAGGPDQPSNMQWQEASAAKAKDKEERRLCRSLK